jgi:hypothetical protein
MSDERFDRIEKRLDELTTRFDRVEGRLDGLTGGQNKLSEGQQKLTEGQQKLWLLFDDQRRLMLVVADGVASMNDRMDRGLAELRGELRDSNAKMDTFIREQSELNREFRSRFSNHEERIQTLERGQ